MFENNKDTKIVQFLEECVKNDWDLDADDIKHVLKLEFDSIKNQYIIDGSFSSVEEMITALRSEKNNIIS